MKYNFVKLLLGGGITDTSNSGAFNRSQVNNSYLDIYKKMFADPNFNVENFNEFLGRYYTLRKGSGFNPTSRLAMKYSGVKNYQKDFDKYGFHTAPFMLGWSHSASAYTGDNFDSGRWEASLNADDYFGSTTALRYANSWNDAELALANLDAKPFGLQWVPDERSAGIDTGDGRKFYKLERINDTTPKNTTVATGNDTDVTDTTSTEEKTPLELNYPIPDKPKNAPWSDWLPLSLLYMNDMMSAERQASLQKKMKFPLVQAPFLQHSRTNNYHLRTGMQQNANELRDLAAFRSNSSDLTQNLRNMHQYDIKASEIENAAEQEKARKTAEEMRLAEQTENTNKQVGAETANKNMQSNVMAWNNIMDANRRRDLSKTLARNSYIGNMATSYGQYALDNRLNDLAYELGVNAYMGAVESLKAIDDYYSQIGDFTKSKAYNDFVNWLTTDSDLVRALELDSEALKGPDRDAYIKGLFSTADFAKPYQDLWTKEKENAEKALSDRLQLISLYRQSRELLQPARVSNQGLYFRPYYKRGGSVRARYIDYLNHINKEGRDAKNALHKRNQLSTRKLERDLDRLSREQMILLRSIFK